ncbi:MAG TPA: alpha/beta hydrolase [Caulobacteraceae bacterium]|nr:alpha/beta hydrolase [Caulobacteraceae bacterium]
MTTKHLEISGLNFALQDEGDGDAVLLLHGFPDSRAVWRKQVPALVSAGYRVVAPDLRGFGETDKPEGVEAYAIPNLVGDVAGIMDALELKSAHVVGHDWGAAVAWAVAAFMPERVKDLVVLSVGHPSSFYGSAPIAQREKSWYMLLFQFPNAEELLAANDWQLFREWGRHHAHMEHAVAALSAPGALTAGLNWYRANVNPLAPPVAFPPVGSRTMGVWSTGDVFLTEESMTGSARYVTAPWRYERINEASHWLQLDRPDLVNSLLLDFLQGGTPPTGG